MLAKCLVPMKFAEAEATFTRRIVKPGLKKGEGLSPSKTSQT